MTRILASRWWLVGVVVVGTALRVAYILELRHTPWFDRLVVDPEYYDAWARRIAAGDWMGERPFYMDPLYPYLLAAVYRLGGRDLLLARLVNVACSAGACLCVALLGRRIAGPAIGGLAALGFALYKPDIFFAGEIDKTSLSVMLSAAALACAFGRSLAARFAAGVALGLAALTRANLLLFAPLTALLLLFERRDGSFRVGRMPRSVAAAVLFLAGFMLALAPVTWRNHHVSGEWVTTTAQAGQNFYTGNNPTNPYGAYGAIPFVRSNPHFEEPDFRAEAEARAGRALTTDEVSRFWFGEALAHMRTNPGFAARAFARKLALFWNDFEISDSQDQYLLARDSRILRLPLVGFGVLVPFVVLGVVSAFGSRRVRVLCAVVLLYCATVVAFFLFARYRVQVVPALLPLAALGMLELAARLRARDGRRLALAGLVLAASALFPFQTIGHFSAHHPNVVEMRLRHLADVYLDAGDPGRAIAALQEAVPNCPHGCPWALKDLFEAYLQSGRFAEGEAYFRTFVREHPEQLDAPEYLARLGAESSARARP